jgi:hypothetical protein
MLWPAFSYPDAKETLYLLHRAVQLIGKLKLAAPFEPHWANAALPITSRGFTSGPIPFTEGIFSIELDIIAHQMICSASTGKSAHIQLEKMSVAQLTGSLFDILSKMNIKTRINLIPQEIEKPIPFDEDTEQRAYDPKQAETWLQLMICSYRVLERYHARYLGPSPYVGLMWGTLDLRDARYIHQRVPTTGINAGYIRRNAMDVAQVEAGFWAGNDAYPRPAYFSFTYPQPAGIERSNILPAYARFDQTLGEFLLDYDDLRQSHDPDQDLFDFFESSYQAGTKLAKWDTTLIGDGKPK